MLFIMMIIDGVSHALWLSSHTGKQCGASWAGWKDGKLV